MRLLITYLVAFFIVGPLTFVSKTTNARDVPSKLGTTKTQKQPSASKTKSSAQPPQVGDKAKNLKVLPPWTMRKCPLSFFATYAMAGAKELKKTDSACALWQTKAQLLEAQTTDFKSVVHDLKTIIVTHKDERKLDQQRIQDLTKQVNTEIAEKNKYKYKPDYKWLWVAVGSAVALAGVCFGVGVWVSKEK